MVNKYDKFLKIAGTNEQLSKDFSNLSRKDFNKKYGTKIKTNKSFISTKTFVISESKKFSITVSEELKKGFKKSVKPKKKKLTQKQRRKIAYKKWAKKYTYGKQRGKIKVNRGKLLNRWEYGSNVWDVKLQNFNSLYNDCKKKMSGLYNAWDIYPNGMQQVIIEALFQFIDKHHKKGYTDWISFQSKTAFHIMLIDLLYQAEKQFNNYRQNLLKKESSKYSIVLDVRIVVIRAGK